MSRCVSLYHALAKASANSSGFLWKRFEDRRVDRVHLQGEVRREHHGGVLLRRIVSVRHGALCRCRPWESTGTHRPGSSSAPTRSRTGSRSSRCPTSPGWWSRRPSRPLVIVWPPLPLLEPCSSSRGLAPRGRRPRVRGRQYSAALAAPWALPKVWPPAISAPRSPRRSWPCGGTFRGCPWRRRADPGLPLGPPGSRRSGPSERRREGSSSCPVAV